MFMKKIPTPGIILSIKVNKLIYLANRLAFVTKLHKTIEEVT